MKIKLISVLSILAVSSSFAGDCDKCKKKKDCDKEKENVELAGGCKGCDKDKKKEADKAEDAGSVVA